MKIGVVGSRKFEDYDFLKEVLDSFLAFYGKFQIISGGAQGADTLAVRYANNHDMPMPFIYEAYWYDLTHPDALIKTATNGNLYDARAGFRRNQKIVDAADLIVAFMDENNPSPGTSDTIERAKKKNTPVMIFWPKGK